MWKWSVVMYVFLEIRKRILNATAHPRLTGIELRGNNQGREQIVDDSDLSEKELIFYCPPYPSSDVDVRFRYC